MGPIYLVEKFRLAADVDSRRRLRSADTSTLLVPATRRSTIGVRAFPVAPARAWNALPAEVRDVETLPMFRRRLKTHFSASASTAKSTASTAGRLKALETFHDNVRCLRSVLHGVT